MSLTSEQSQKIEILIAEVVSRQGCILYDFDLLEQGPHGRALRIFIDKAGGASIDDCSNVSRGLNEFLEADEDIIPGPAYHLEVSTPGLERVLKRQSHFEAVIGKKAKVKLTKGLAEIGNPDVPETIRTMKNFTGVIGPVTATAVEFALELSADHSQTVKVPFSAIEKAQLVFDFDSQDKKQKPGGSGKHPKKKHQ